MHARLDGGHAGGITGARMCVDCGHRELEDKGDLASQENNDKRQQVMGQSKFGPGLNVSYLVAFVA